MRALAVLLGDRRVGTLAESDDLWRFAYDSRWRCAADSFDLAPSLPRAQGEIIDGATNRPVQWYFDNLLPEEALREAVSREARIRGEDAFGLLTWLGAESAGSLTLLPPDHPLPAENALRPLPDAELAERIARLPRETLGAQAPKLMSLAGAQHKLLVVVKDGQLYEPVGATPSTHILKPQHPDETQYPASVLNETITMRLAAAVGLSTAAVGTRQIPAPVYLVERFDRRPRPGAAGAAPVTERLHIIDGCQLLGRARGFKYAGATLESLRALALATRNRVQARVGLFRWLVFNVIVGNDDSHLKNLSFFARPDGYALAPHYDLLSTAAYRTRAIAQDRAKWPDVDMAFPLPGARTFGEVTRPALVDAGGALGLNAATASRIVRELVARIPAAFQSLKVEVQTIQAARPPALAGLTAIETRTLGAIECIVVRDTLARIAAS